MRTGEIHRAVQNPASVDGSQLSEWESLVEKYPYFSVGRILLAKSSHEAGHLDYKTHLHLAALYAGDRQELYRLIIGPALREKIERLDAEVENEEISEEIISPEEVEQTPESASPEGEKEKETATELEEVELVLPKESDTRPTSIEIVDELEREILYEAVYSTIEREVQEDIEEEQSEVETEVPEREENSKLSPYTRWLQERARQIHYQTSEESEQERASEKASQLDLIDKFIKSDPKITRRSQELFSNENLAKMSLVEDEDFVTETLARVYVKQGKMDKAIKAYKQLSLKYPEKSIYFANQLKKLQNKT